MIDQIPHATKTILSILFKIRKITWEIKKIKGNTSSYHNSKSIRSIKNAYFDICNEELSNLDHIVIRPKLNITNTETCSESSFYSSHLNSNISTVENINLDLQIIFQSQEEMQSLYSILPDQSPHNRSKHLAEIYSHIILFEYLLCLNTVRTRGQDTTNVINYDTHIIFMKQLLDELRKYNLSYYQYFTELNWP